MKVLAVILMLLAAAPAWAANVYVRDGGTCTSNCTSWTNAADQITTALGLAVRGDTIYVADGAYTGFTAGNAPSGSLTLVIKKATVADHGTSTGWADTMGDGQATIADITVTTSYWVIDGQTRNAANWQQDTAYGFRVTGIIALTGSISNLTFKYLDVGSAPGTTWPNVIGWCFRMTDAASPRRSAIYVGFSHLHNCELHFHSRNNDTVTIEYTHIGPGFSKESIGHQFGNGWIIRYNKFVDACVQPQNEGCTAWIGVFNFTGGGPPEDAQSDNWELYGNIFAATGAYALDTADGLIEANSVNNWKFYNNTISRTGGHWGGYLFFAGSNNLVRNNLWYWMGNYDSSWGSIVGTGSANTNNSWCYYKNTLPARLGADCSALAGTVVNGNSDPFVDEANGDWHLKTTITGPSPKNTGTNLGAPYNVDMDGNVRGADGQWDIGAFEFGTAAPPPNAPTNLLGCVGAGCTPS